MNKSNDIFPINKYGIIYIITNKINEKVYIGQTTRALEVRKKQHQSDCKKVIHKKLKLTKAFIMFGFDSFIFEEIAKAYSKDELDTLEMYYVKKYNSTKDEYGYNMTNGGCSSGMHTEEVKKRISDSGKNIKRTKEWLKNQSDALKGKYIGDKSSFYGKKHTEETKKKISDAQIGSKNHNFGKKAGRKTKIKMSLAHSDENSWNHKKVKNIDTGKIYTSALEASKKTKIDNSSICKCCRGERNYTGGYRWEYVRKD